MRSRPAAEHIERRGGRGRRGRSRAAKGVELWNRRCGRRAAKSIKLCRGRRRRRGGAEQVKRIRHARRSPRGRRGSSTTVVESVEGGKVAGTSSRVKIGEAAEAALCPCCCCGRCRRRCRRRCRPRCRRRSRSRSWRRQPLEAPVIRRLRNTIQGCGTHDGAWGVVGRRGYGFRTRLCRARTLTPPTNSLARCDQVSSPPPHARSPA